MRNRPGLVAWLLTGVYAGIMGTEYGTQIQHASEDVTGYGYMGTATCVAAAGCPTA